MDGSQTNIISDADLAAEFQKCGEVRCQMAADRMMGRGAIKRLRDIPQDRRAEFLAILHNGFAAEGADVDTGRGDLGSQQQKDAEQGEQAQAASLEMAKEHIKLLTGSADTSVEFRCVNKKKRPTWDNPRPVRCFFGQVARCWVLIEQLIKGEYDISIVPNPGRTDGKASKAADITGIGVICLEMDALPSQWHLMPSFVVHTSPGHGHAYWRVSGVMAEEFNAIQNRAYAYYGDTKKGGACDRDGLGVHHPLRLAGTLRQKSGKPVTLVAVKAGAEGIYTRDQFLTGLPEASPEPNKTSRDTSRHDPITPEQLREMLSYIHPVFDGSAADNFDAKKFGGEFRFGMNEWAGLARMILNGEILLAGNDAEEFNWPELSLEWSSGELWRERTGQDIATSCPDGIEALETRLAGEMSGGGYTVGTIIKLAHACGFKGRVGVPKASHFERGSDIELAQRLLADLEHENGSGVIHAEGEFYQYDGKRWAVLGENDLRLRVHRFDGMRHGEKHYIIRLGQSRVSSILHEAAVMVERPGFFDIGAIGINCESGFICFDVKGEPSLTPHDPDHRTRHVIPATWQPEMDLSWEAPLLSQLLNGCFRDDADADQRRDLVGEICGAVAMGLPPQMLKQPKATVLFGKHANNGKNQILDMCRGLVPPEALASVNPSQFDQDPYRLKLRGKLLNTASELGTARTVASEAFKYIVTGDPMTVNVKHREAVEFRARAVHMFATNVLPPFQGGMDRGVRRRLMVLNFTRVFEPHEMIEGIGERIASKETDALLTFAVAGASRLLKRGQYTEPPSCATTLRDWVLSSDPVLAWVDCRTDYAKGHTVLQHDLYADFESWARREGFDPKHLPAINNFIARVLANDGRLSKHQSGHAGKGGRVIRGLRLRTEQNEAASEPSEGPDLPDKGRDDF